MPEIQYPKNPNSDTAFVVQEDGTKNRALMTAPQDTSSLELPTNSNSCKGYVTVDGKKQRVILTADIGGGGGSSLPDQTGQSGKFLTTDGTDASWSDKPLVNIGTGANTLFINGSTSGTGTNGNNNVIIGKQAYSNSGSKAVAIGSNAVALSAGGVSIGHQAQAWGEGSIAIGYYPVCNNAKYAVQLGGKVGNCTNSDANTFKVGNANGNFEIMSADGTVPTARLTKVNTTATLAVADWSSNTQTVTVSGVKADSVVFVSPDPTSASDYASAGILCTAQAADSLTFTCTTTPTNAITVNVVCM